MQVEEVARAVSDEHVTEGGGVRLGVGTETAVVRAEGHVVVEWVQSARDRGGGRMEQEGSTMGEARHVLRTVLRPLTLTSRVLRTGNHSRPRQKQLDHCPTTP